MRLSLGIIARLLAVVACLAWPAGQAGAATANASVNANALKPLVLAKVQDFNLGSVTLGPGTWGNTTISLSRAGVLGCVSVNVTCSGATVVAQYNVQGSNHNTVHISAPNVLLTNQNDPSQTLILVVDSPTTIVLPNSGIPGVNFSIGGSVTVNSATATGTYAGTFNVTVDY